MIIKLPIDTKSLFYNIFNDNLAGHTATVATVIKQGNSLNEKLNKLFEINTKIDIQSKPDLIKECVKNSKAMVKILDFFVFNKIAVNGTIIATDSLYGIYAKQEIDESKYQYGRIKMHYPNTLKYEDDDVRINNSSVMSAISKELCDFAFLVNAFEFNTETCVLNFNLTILGVNKTPYSKVFINEKGAGNKMITAFIDEIDIYDIEIVSLRQNINPDINTSNYIDIMINNKKLAIKEIISDLMEADIHVPKTLSEKFPYLPYDIEYNEDGIKKYIIVVQTSTNIEYFNLSLNKIIFLTSFSSITKIALVTSINKNPQVHYYTMEDVRSFQKSMNSIQYTRN